jgi:hypothetical protein
LQPSAISCRKGMKKAADFRTPERIPGPCGRPVLAALTELRPDDVLGALPAA